MDSKNIILKKSRLVNNAVSKSETKFVKSFIPLGAFLQQTAQKYRPTHEKRPVQGHAPQKKMKDFPVLAAFSFFPAGAACAVKKDGAPKRAILRRQPKRFLTADNSGDWSSPH